MKELSNLLNREKSLYLMSFFYVISGFSHFVFMEFYLSIMPDYIPLHKEFISLSGVVLIVLGFLLLVKSYRGVACYSIIILLIALFPANLYQFYSYIGDDSVVKITNLIRLPFQFFLIYWAFYESKVIE